MYSPNEFLPENSGKSTIGPSRTLTYLCVFAYKFLYPELYSDKDITREQFETLLDLCEENINIELEKVEKEINIKEEKMDDGMRAAVEDQIEYLIDSGELFLEAIEEMRMYLESNEENGESKEYLLKGIELAKKADNKLRKSLEIFEDLRESN